MNGRTVAGRWTGGGRADVGQRRGRRADGRTAQRMEANRRTSGQAGESGQGTDRAD